MSDLERGVNPYKAVILAILQESYAKNPWHTEEMSDKNEPVPLDLIMYDDGGLPILWRQVQQSALLLDIPEKLLPATLVRDEEAMIGWRVEWKPLDLYTEESAGDAEIQAAMRSIIPALILDSLIILSQQEDVLMEGNHLGMFTDKHSLTKTFTRNVLPEMLLQPIQPTETDEHIRTPSDSSSIH